MKNNCDTDKQRGRGLHMGVTTPNNQATRWQKDRDCSTNSRPNTVESKQTSWTDDFPG
ncbi:uncharacterized protein BO87DRAFT_376413 [Aspergillus neoniger CBS 115656]|uniref:Uncharacterized protein n=1 Tax=Aspergillus neoniger (strain CBS 115656) TaxID=1448310 RepID=A0A318YL20_ASPNB|nr:hypothetical protein BO87DRAFT_376413 [Aspergillus neoniger CBS 115656]PYH34537.1 hypothetical protein BO87DRAFT_376413 [Aspergillus neoniger CBS 115656]